jgi:hypothetical protein
MAWRHMQPADLRHVFDVSRLIHVHYPEDAHVLEERYTLYPDGCFSCEQQGELVGYAISHPWLTDSVPSLNTMLRLIPPASDTYYLHDIALMPSTRLFGFGRQVVALIKAHAAGLGFKTLSLVAVNRSGGFWQREGFRAKDVPALKTKLASYDAEAAYMQCGLSPAT